MPVKAGATRSSDIKIEAFSSPSARGGGWRGGCSNQHPPPALLVHAVTGALFLERAESLRV